jgi:predicted MPP superfamily phosphohydrolase
MTGRERRWLNPNRGLFKRIERFLDRFASRYVFPHLFGVWNPYSWQLPRRLVIAEATIRPEPWPRSMTELRVLLLTDIHAGPFLRPEVLQAVLEDLMRLEPDLVAVGGDVVGGADNDLDPFLDGLAALSRAPLGAWFCMGNHEYFTPDPGHVVEQLAAVGIRTLRNHAVRLEFGGSSFVLGGLPFRFSPIGLACSLRGHTSRAARPQSRCLLRWERRGIGLVFSGHTHGGQIHPRPPWCDRAAIARRRCDVA